MKIIGKTKDGFIVTVSKNEIESLLSVNDGRRKKLEESINVGDELTFTTALANLNNIKDLNLSGSYKTLGKLKDARDEINAAIKVVEGCDVELLKIQSGLKEKES